MCGCVGLAVGLDPEGYGNPDFCWLSIHDSLVWSLAGPSACAVAVRRMGIRGAYGARGVWVIYGVYGVCGGVGKKWSIE